MSLFLSRNRASYRLAAPVCLLLCCVSATAQTGRLRPPPPGYPASQPHEPLPAPSQGVPASAPAGNAATAGQPAAQAAASSPPAQLPPSMLQQPPSPATIRFHPGTVSIYAQNSSLSQILHDLSAQSGMKVDGLSSDERVFGTFGPGEPHDVLSALLNGTPYNILMVGDLSNGAPRELILSRQSQPGAENHGYSSLAAAPNTSSNNSDDEDSDNGDTGSSGPPQPGVNPGANPPPANPGPGVRTPQQIFQELQRRQQQQQQQPQ